MKNRPQIKYIKNVAIVHGKSEAAICEYIKSNLRLSSVDIYKNSGGSNNIEISSLNKILKNVVFKNRASFSKNFPIIEKKKLSKDDLEIFLIMDKDRCNHELFERFKDKSMFDEKQWLFDLITPIYNVECLEDVLVKAGYRNMRKHKDKYFKLFPINRGELCVDEIRKFHENLLKTAHISNMHVFVKKCLDSAE